jgi:hypothetical protein
MNTPKLEDMKWEITMEDLHGHVGKDKHHYVRVKHVNGLLLNMKRDIQNLLDTERARLVERMRKEFNRKFYFLIQQNQIKQEDIDDWFDQAIDIVRDK